MNILYIDSSSNREIKVGLSLKNDKFEFIKAIDSWKAQIVLPLILNILKERQITLQDLNSIEVNTGPGSFTGLRVGVAIANALGTWLKIPVNGKKAGIIAVPIYQ